MRHSTRKLDFRHPVNYHFPMQNKTLQPATSGRHPTSGSPIPLHPAATPERDAGSATIPTAPPTTVNDADAVQSSDRRRYRRILRFFAGVIGHFILLDLLLGRLPLVRQRIVASRTERLRHMARRFRSLAVEMGGVLIKLGQFLSAG
ncbi:MAG: hypothetical protein R2932_57615 [Caldilineaceae bacterium]